MKEEIDQMILDLAQEVATQDLTPDQLERAERRIEVLQKAKGQ